MIRIDWRPRERPLAAVAAVGQGDVALQLARRLLESDLTALRGVTANANGIPFLVVVGPTTELPWVGGVEYLGRDEHAPTLLLPTSLEPSVPVAVFEAALRRRSLPAVLAVLPPNRLIPLVNALPIERALLQRFLDAA